MKADVKELIGKILNTPVVVETGTSGNWYYRKWSDGTAECWGRYVFNVTATEMSFAVSFPFTFADTNAVVNITARDIGFGSSNTAQTNAGVGSVAVDKVNVIHKGPFSGYSQTLQIYAIGRCE